MDTNPTPTPIPDWRTRPDAYLPEARDGVRALLLDDDPLDVALVSRLAPRSSQFAISLTSCRTVEEASAALSKQSFDILFVDYWLGLHTSIAFIHKQAQSQGAPFVLLTGLDVPDVRRCAFRAGVAGYLAKDDLSIQAIEGVMSAVLARRQSLA
jgi:DNA-binding NarL/FixJ family response regulator